MSSQKRQSTLSRFFTTIKPSQSTESTLTEKVSSKSPPPPPPPPTAPPSLPSEKLLEFGFDGTKDSTSTRTTTTKSKDVEKRKSTTSSGSSFSSESKPKRPKEKRLTPLEKQILELTEQHQDKILLIQIGYKYKVFGINALKVSKILNIMYISNDIEDTRFHYCSIPDTRLHIHLQRILSHGYKVGVVKQIESTIVKQIEKHRNHLMLCEEKLLGFILRQHILVMNRMKIPRKLGWFIIIIIIIIRCTGIYCLY